MQRPIIGFHQDSENHWVADLDCGHSQHVRHDPPWQVRPWVLSEDGRAKFLGTALDCPKCTADRATGHLHTMTCIFCDIVAGRAPASFVYRDDLVSAFMTLQPTAPGECLVIPNAHIDHFTDVPDALAAHIVTVAQRIGRRMRTTFPLDRVGYLVHGYGVAHAHLVIVPQQGPHHLTSDRFACVTDGQVVFDLGRVPVADRSTLDSHARLLAQAWPPNDGGS